MRNYENIFESKDADIQSLKMILVVCTYLVLLVIIILLVWV